MVVLRAWGAAGPACPVVGAIPFAHQTCRAALTALTIPPLHHCQSPTRFDASVSVRLAPGSLQACSDASYIIPLGLAAPYAWRLVQCIRVYLDTGARPQLFNALKYSTAFPVGWLPCWQALAALPASLG